MLPRPLCPPGGSQVCAQGVRWVQDHRPAPCIDCGKGLRGICVPMGSTGKAGASPSAALLQECTSPAGAGQVGFHTQDGSQPRGWVLGSGIEEHPQRGAHASPEAGREG